MIDKLCKNRRENLTTEEGFGEGGEGGEGGKIRFDVNGSEYAEGT